MISLKGKRPPPGDRDNSPRKTSDDQSPRKSPGDASPAERSSPGSDSQESFPSSVSFETNRHRVHVRLKVFHEGLARVPGSSLPAHTVHDLRLKSLEELSESYSFLVTDCLASTERSVMPLSILFFFFSFFLGQ